MSKSSHTQWESVAVLSPVKLTFDLQGQLQDRTTENALETKLTGRTSKSPLQLLLAQVKNMNEWLAIMARYHECFDTVLHESPHG